MPGRKNQCIYIYRTYISKFKKPLLFPTVPLILSGHFKSVGCHFSTWETRTNQEWGTASSSRASLLEVPLTSANVPPSPQIHPRRLTWLAWQWKILICSRKCVFTRWMFHCYVTYVSFQGGIAGFFFGPNPIQTIPFAREHQTSNINPRLQSMGPGLVINGVMGHLTYKYQWPKMNGFHRGYFTYFIRAHLVGSRDPNGRHYHNYILQQNMRDPARKPNLQHQIWVNIHTFIIYISTYYLYVNIYIYRQSIEIMGHVLSVQIINHRNWYPTRSTCPKDHRQWSQHCNSLRLVWPAAASLLIFPGAARWQPSIVLGTYPCNYTA